MKRPLALLASLALFAGCQANETKPSAAAPAAAAPAGPAKADALPAQPAPKPAAAAAATDADKSRQAVTAAYAADPNLPYQATRSDPVTYEVDFSAIVMPPYHAHVVKVWLPIPQSDFGQEVTDSELSTFPMKVEPKIGTEKVFGNKFAYFEFKEPNGAQQVRHKFKVKVYQLNWNLDPKRVAPAADWPASFEPYLRGETQAVVTADERFSKLLTEIVPKPGNPLSDMSNVMDFVIKDFKYSHDKSSLKASSINAITQHSGHCSDYHGFCSAMGRLLKSPTRVTYGINPFPKNSPSHCKMEAFLPAYGWVSFDVSETQNLLGAIAKDPKLDDAAKARLSQAAKDRLVSGYRDNTWYIQTRGTDYDLEPPAAQRVPVVRTVYVEADGVNIPDVDTASTLTKTFGWMTMQDFKPDRPVTYPFKDIKSLDAK